MGRRKPRRWVKTVTEHIHEDSAGAVRSVTPRPSRGRLTLPRVSPKGPVSGLRMLSFFIDRAGHQLSRARRAELEKAKRPCSRGSQQKGPVLRHEDEGARDHATGARDDSA